MRYVWITFRALLATLFVAAAVYALAGCAPKPEKMDWKSLAEYLEAQDVEKVRKP
jgi:hypothetical protein